MGCHARRHGRLGRGPGSTRSGLTAPVAAAGTLPAGTAGGAVKQGPAHRSRRTPVALRPRTLLQVAPQIVPVVGEEPFDLAHVTTTEMVEQLVVLADQLGVIAV